MFSLNTVNNNDISEAEQFIKNELESKILKLGLLGLDINEYFSTITFDFGKYMYNNGDGEYKLSRLLIDTLDKCGYTGGLLALIANPDDLSDSVRHDNGHPIYPPDLASTCNIYKLAFLNSSTTLLLRGKIIYIPFGSTNHIDQNYFTGVRLDHLIINSNIDSMTLDDSSRRIEIDSRCNYYYWHPNWKNDENNWWKRPSLFIRNSNASFECSIGKMNCRNSRTMLTKGVTDFTDAAFLAVVSTDNWDVFTTNDGIEHLKDYYSKCEVNRDSKIRFPLQQQRLYTVSHNFINNLDKPTGLTTLHMRSDQLSEFKSVWDIISESI